MEKDYKFIDLFAGAGGFSLGFEMAHYSLVCAVEKDEWAVDTLKANHAPEKIIHADLSEIDEIHNIVDHDVDVIIGGPPCQGFSNATSKKKDIKDPRNSLFIHFVKWVESLSPQLFVMENVPGILTKKNSKGESISKIIEESFKDLGYEVSIWKLNAANYGVPQSRERIFFVGSRYKLIIPPPPISHFLKSKKTEKKEKGLIPAITIGDAILDLPSIKAKEGEEIQEYTLNPFSKYQKWARKKSNNVFNHVSMKHTPRLVSRFKAIQDGINFNELPDELKVKARNGNGVLSNSRFNSNYRHLKSNEVSHTIPASFYSSFVHPTIPRNLTAREAARIQSFPDYYKFMGQRTLISKKLLRRLGKDHSDRLSQYNQIGNAVPPLLSKAIADHIKKFLVQKETKLEKEELTFSTSHTLVSASLHQKSVPYSPKF